MSDLSVNIWGALGAALGSGFLGSLLNAWFTARSKRREEAVDSANAKSQINMLSDADRRAKEAEADADKERAARLQWQERALIADANLLIAKNDILRLQRKLDEEGVPRTDYGDLVQTNFGALHGEDPAA